MSPLDHCAGEPSRIVRLRGGESHRIASPKGGTFTLGRELGLRLRPDAMPAGAAIVIDRAPGLSLPLLRRQVPLGSAYEIRADQPLGAPADLTIAYDAARLAKAGLRPSDIVVLSVADGERIVRELRPHAFDPIARTVTVRTA